MQGPLTTNTQNSQETGTYSLGGIRTRKPRKQAAANPRLRPRGHYDRPDYVHTHCIYFAYHF